MNAPLKIPARNGATIALPLADTRPAKSRRARIEPRLWTIGDLSAALAISEATLFEMCKHGDIPHRKLGSKILRFVPAEIDRWIAEGCGVEGYSAAMAQKREARR